MKLLWIAGLVLLVSMWACHPGGPENIAESDTVITIYDDQFNFGAKQTYAMPDEVFLREGSEDVDTRFFDLILSDVARNMAQIGFTRESNPGQNGADVAVIVSVSRTTTTLVGTGWWPGWGGWWGWWGPGWGGWYPYPVVTSFTTGSIFIEMYDPEGRDEANQTVPVRWVAVTNGLVGTTGDVTAQRITRAINQAFAQSPYLGQR
jgi:hypothetical protein